MTRTITAMYRTREEAQRAADRIQAPEIGVTDVDIVDQGAQSDTPAPTSRTERGLWSSIKDLFLPDEDRHTYEEGLRRGHALLTARVDEAQVDRVCDVLEGSDAVDVDMESSRWREEGWEGPRAPAAAPTVPDTGRARATESVAEERIPVVEEELAIGKREVSRGGARIRSYVRETPVHEEVRLRQEHVDIERRPVGEMIEGGPGDLLRDRTIEVAERGEEAVVEKRAIVREEVVVRKDVGERVESIDDSVRHTEVEVDRLEDERLAARTRPSVTDRDRLG